MSISSLLRRVMPKTLLMRFAVIMILPILFGQMISIILFYDRYWYNISHYASHLIAGEIMVLLDTYNTADHAATQTMQNHLSISYVLLPGQSIPAKQPRLREELEIFRNILSKKIDLPFVVLSNSDRTVSVYLQSGEDMLKIHFSSKLLLTRTAYLFVLWISSITVVLMILSLLFLRKQISSIVALARAADSFGNNSAQRVDYKPRGPQEIKLAGIALLKMKARLENRMLKRTQMLAMIAHDLRTPLTRIQLQLDLMNEFDERDRLRKDIEVMIRILDSYNDFARGEGGEEFQEVDFISWIDEVIGSKYHNLLTNQKLTLRTKIRSCDVCIKPFAFERVIMNLISNAQKYGNNVLVTVNFEESLKCLSIWVEDDGSGVAEHEREKVFEPFYRGDKSRRLDGTGNVGLGLAIAKEIILDHFGEIRLDTSDELGGLKVVINIKKIYNVEL
ncbi:Two-component sensor histidine kinase [Rickettsiales endosymbiont of Paramecium tredecaurelia]|uniref:sensor histidine kinase n=1 Tax=Candidatus Sarmatiella mevalonica TaxID=2770581 RepID=UPI0019219591|nr:ATP-binding protein [Candidatus Sarmatiella mevalonica]MBL3284612.1 Two-component sensor histidine kinase [Candidatus Sarmatiella mevalonica]